jgi:hypothetical protein
LPLKSRDELPPILAGLQWLWMHPTLKAEIFALLEAKILAGKQATGRTGMDLWQILVLGVVRLGLDADWDRHGTHGQLRHLLVRQMLWGAGPPGARTPKSSGIKPCGTTSRCWMTNCCNKSTRALPPQDARCSQKKTARPSRRLKSRWTPTCWKRTCISPPT